MRNCVNKCVRGYVYVCEFEKTSSNCNRLQNDSLTAKFSFEKKVVERIYIEEMRKS